MRWFDSREIALSVDTSLNGIFLSSRSRGTSDDHFNHFIVAEKSLEFIL